MVGNFSFHSITPQMPLLDCTDKKLIKELDMKTTDVLPNMCKHNPPSAQPTYKDKKAEPIYKCVFCDFIYSTRVCTSYIHILLHLAPLRSS